jgi:hypothetical protein
MKLPRRKFLHLAAGVAVLPVSSRDRNGANLRPDPLMVAYAADTDLHINGEIK